MFSKRKTAAPEAPPKVLLHNAEEDLVYDEDKGVGFVGKQVITDHFKTALKDDRAESTRKREKNFMHIGSIPVIFVNKWKREGFDIFDKNVTFRDIARKLREEGLDDFITTAKRF